MLSQALHALPELVLGVAAEDFRRFPDRGRLGRVHEAESSPPGTVLRKPDRERHGDLAVGDTQRIEQV